VVPPLLNDFIGLQKDTAIITVIGVVEALNLSQQFSTDYGSFTGYTVAALFFIFLTIPLARFTDHLVAERERRERALAM
jgi:polar amino acid transport system permease protein